MGAGFYSQECRSYVSSRPTPPSNECRPPDIPRPRDGHGRCGRAGKARVYTATVLHDDILPLLLPAGSLFSSSVAPRDSYGVFLPDVMHLLLSVGSIGRDSMPNRTRPRALVEHVMHPSLLCLVSSARPGASTSPAGDTLYHRRLLCPCGQHGAVAAPLVSPTSSCAAGCNHQYF